METVIKAKGYSNKIETFEFDPRDKSNLNEISSFLFSHDKELHEKDIFSFATLIGFLEIGRRYFYFDTFYSSKNLKL